MDLFNGNELACDATRNASYVDFLEKWREKCGSERIHVFLFEEVFSDPRGFMCRLADMFGLAANFYDGYAFPRENETYSVRSKSLQKINILVRPLVPRGQIYQNVRRAYRAMNTRRPVADQEPIDEFDVSLAERYRRSNERLASAFGLDLTAWDKVADARRAHLGI
jgi:hypothetical protein